jgi:hypothetical protein
MSEEVKRPCPRCGCGSWHNDRKGKWFCFHCNRGGTLAGGVSKQPSEKRPKPNGVPSLGGKPISLEPLSERAREFLRKFPEAPIEEFRTVHLSWGEYICSSSAWVLKPLDKTKCKPLTLIKGNELLTREGSDTVIIVEDFISGLVHWNCGYSALVLHGTNLQNPELLQGFQQILVWTDPDSPGYKATRKLSLNYGWISIRSDKDPKYYTSQEINQYLENHYGNE